ncbi:MAG TPA: sugar ABC transporter permease [Candidatus Omnitrophica bacterium]|nr:sugar ABC transporter permease [Candidatus Omnitrophota bacterium]
MRIKHTLTNYLFVLPAVLIFGIFYVYPFIKVFQLSLMEWDGILPTMQFIGIDNFKEIMEDKIWWGSMWHAGYITLIALTFQNGLALLLALACNKEIRAKNFYRVLFFIPPILSEVVVGLVWQWILDGNYGVLNNILTSIGLQSMVRNWLADPKTALTCIAIVHSWKGFGWGFIILLAGLQTIPRQLYEAARVDGAGSWQSFTKVTIPLMMPVFSMVIILTILGSMQVFVLIIAMVGQGLVYHTTVPVLRILGAMTGSSRFGYACAQGIVFGLVLIVVSFTQKKFSEKMKYA